jgi:hypothetical protein
MGCGIIAALGPVNFLSDKSFESHMKIEDIYGEFGLNKSSGGNHSKKVREVLGMSQFDPAWCLPSLMENNPRAWYIMVNGMVVDARSRSRGLQEIAYENGLIPSISQQIKNP